MRNRSRFEPQRSSDFPTVFVTVVNLLALAAGVTYMLIV